MKISGAGSVMYGQPSKLHMQMNWVRKQVNAAKSKGETSVSFALQDDKLIQNLQRAYGKDNVSIKTSDTKRVTLRI